MTGLESYVNALETARQTFFEMDDALGQLSCAIDVIEALTEGTSLARRLTRCITITGDCARR